LAGSCTCVHGGKFCISRHAIHDGVTRRLPFLLTNPCQCFALCNPRTYCEHLQPQCFSRCFAPPWHASYSRQPGAAIQRVFHRPP
jgi:hypothetical protein